MELAGGGIPRGVELPLVLVLYGGIPLAGGTLSKGNSFVRSGNQWEPTGSGPQREKLPGGTLGERELSVRRTLSKENSQ